MNLLTKLLGSHQSSSLPYIYQAVVNLIEGDDSLKVSFFSDTICGLVGYLKKHQDDPGSTTLYEIYKGQEKQIPHACYLDEEGHWLCRNALCFPMTVRYGNPKNACNCPFRGRSHAVI